MRFILAMAMLAVAASGWAADAGEIKTAHGQTFIERGGQRIAAVAGMSVQEADKLITGADGTLGVTMSDNTLLSVGPNSVLAINKYAFDSTTYEGEFDAGLSKGSLAVVSGRIVKQTPGAMRVRTPSSIMGVRGTDFVVRVD